MAPRFKLRWKILLSFLGLSVLPLVAALWMLVVSGQEEMRQDHEARIQSTQHILHATIQQLFYQTQQTTRFLALMASDIPAGQLEKRLQSDRKLPVNLPLILRFSPEQQRALYNVTAEDNLPDLGQLDLVQEALRGVEGTGFRMLGGQLALVTAVPIKGGGALLGGLLLDDATAIRFRTLTGSEVAFYSGDRVYGSSRNLLRGYPPSQFADTPEDHATEMTLEGKPYSLSRIPLGPDQGLLLAVTLEKHLAASQRLQWSMVELALGALLAALVLGLWMSARIVRPLGGVVNNLNEIAEGEADLTRSLQVRGTDEIALLAANFNRFIGRLRQMVQRTDLVAVDLAEESQRIQQTANQVNQDAGQQKKALEQSTSALQEIEHASSEVALHTTQLLEVAEASGHSVRQLEIVRHQMTQHMDSLFAAVSDVSGTTREISLAGMQLTDTVEGLFQNAESSASALTQMEQSLKTIEQRVAETSQLAQSTAVQADKGHSAAQESVEGVTSLCDTLEGAAHSINELGRQSEAIGQILNLVNDFADQTSLLALNASVIASQAGEQGQGFAVIAQEIRELAERTSRSVDEVGEIVGDLQVGSRQASRVMQQGTERARKEVDKALAAGEMLAQIRQSIYQVIDQVADIVQASGEQSQGSHQLTLSAEQLTSMLEQMILAVRRQADDLKQLSAVASNVETIASEGKTSLHNHSDNSQKLRGTMERMREMIERIHAATQEQVQSCQQVVEHYHDLHRIGEQYALKADELDQAVEIIGRKSALLKRGIRAFRT